MVHNPIGVFSAGWRVLRASGRHAVAYVVLIVALNAMGAAMSVYVPFLLMAMYGFTLLLVAVYAFAAMTIVFAAAGLGHPVRWFFAGVAPGKVFAVLVRFFAMGIVVALVLGMAMGMGGGGLDGSGPIDIAFLLRVGSICAIGVLAGLVVAIPLGLGIPAIALRRGRGDKVRRVDSRWRLLPRMAVRLVIASVPVTALLILLGALNLSELVAASAVSPADPRPSVEQALRTFAVNLVAIPAMVFWQAMFAAVLVDAFVAGGGGREEEPPPVPVTTA